SLSALTMVPHFRPKYSELAEDAPRRGESARAALGCYQRSGGARHDRRHRVALIERNEPAVDTIGRTFLVRKPRSALGPGNSLMPLPPPRRNRSSLTYRRWPLGLPGCVRGSRS